MSEPIEPLDESYDVDAMARGEPGPPRRFRWRDRDHEIAAVERHWKAVSPEGGRAGNELYVRRHYFQIRTAAGDSMVLYAQRSVSRGASPRRRWFLYTTAEPGGAGG